MGNWIALLLVAVIVGYVGLGISGILAAKMLQDRLNSDERARREAWQDVSQQLEALYELLAKR